MQPYAINTMARHQPARPTPNPSVLCLPQRRERGALDTTRRADKPGQPPAFTLSPRPWTCLRCNVPCVSVLGTLRLLSRSLPRRPLLTMQAAKRVGTQKWTDGFGHHRKVLFCRLVSCRDCKNAQLRWPPQFHELPGVPVPLPRPQDTWDGGQRPCRSGIGPRGQVVHSQCASCIGRGSHTARNPPHNPQRWPCRCPRSASRTFAASRCA